MISSWGPDAYRDLPGLVAGAEEGEKGVNVFLSREETYADISPVRLQSNGVTAFISIMRGCDNMCSFLRGALHPRPRAQPARLQHRRRSYTTSSTKRFREVTLLGQNVDSYKWDQPRNGTRSSTSLSCSPSTAAVDPLTCASAFQHQPPQRHHRRRTLHAMRDHENVCKYIHLPVQSGNSRILDLNEPYLRRALGTIAKVEPDLRDHARLRHQRPTSSPAFVRRRKQNTRKH